MRLADLIARDRIEPDLRVTDKRGALDALAGLLARGAEGFTAAQVATVLREREALASTGIGDEVAIPHGKLAGLGNVIAAIALVPAGLDFDAIDRRPVRIFFAILAPERAASDHLRALARCSKLLRDARTRARLVAARTADDVFAIVRDDGV